jgi:hypothetical protein
MIGDALTGLSLPVVEPLAVASTPEDGFAASSGKVVALRPRRADRQP